MIIRLIPLATRFSSYYVNDRMDRCTYMAYIPIIWWINVFNNANVVTGEIYRLICTMVLTTELIYVCIKSLIFTASN